MAYRKIISRTLSHISKLRQYNQINSSITAMEDTYSTETIFTTVDCSKFYYCRHSLELQYILKGLPMHFDRRGSKSPSVSSRTLTH